MVMMMRRMWRCSRCVTRLPPEDRHRKSQVATEEKTKKA
jgi:hypothetical protein